MSEVIDAEVVPKRKIKVYIAATWVHKADAKEAKDALEAAGFQVTSRWIEFHGDTTDPAELEREALNDLEDIIDCDAMLVLQLCKSEGKSFEQGFLLGYSAFVPIYNDIIVVSPTGERGSVFQYLASLYKFVPDLTSALEAAKGWTDR